MIQEFNNDADYLAWLVAHPTDYVLNVHKNPQNWYLVLHQTTCPHISRISGRGKEGGFTERTFRKIVSDQEAELKGWMRGKKLSGEFSSVCRKCFKVH